MANVPATRHRIKRMKERVMIDPTDRGNVLKIHDHESINQRTRMTRVTNLRRKAELVRGHARSRGALTLLRR